MHTYLIIAVAALLSATAFVFLDRKLAALGYTRRRPATITPPPVGEGAMIMRIIDYYFKMPFRLVRWTLLFILILPATMFFVNIKGYAEWNLIATVLIVLVTIKLFRWQTILGVMLAGSVEDWLASTKEKPEDLTEGALEGLGYFLKAMGYTIVGVWILSIILAFVPFKETPTAFPLLLLGACGFFLYSTLQGFKGVAWIRHGIIMIIFLSVFALGIKTYFGLSLADVKNILASYNLSLSSIGIFGLVGTGIYLYFNEKEEH